MRRLGLAIVSSAILMVATAGAAVAGPGGDPNTVWVGACNMLHDGTMGTIPMSVNNLNGRVGMSGAVAASGGCFRQ